MMEDDNRVYFRIRGVWKTADPGFPLGVTPLDGWPELNERVLRDADLIVWRGKVLKDRWNKFDRGDFLEGIRDI